MKTSFYKRLFRCSVDESCHFDSLLKYTFLRSDNSKYLFKNKLRLDSMSMNKC